MVNPVTYAGFTTDQAAKIVAAVNAINNPQTNTNLTGLPQGKSGTLPILIGKITSVIDNDSGIGASSQAGAFQPYGFGTGSPFNTSDTTSATVDSPYTCWAWGGDKQRFEVGMECIFVYSGGRWYAIPCIPQPLLLGKTSGTLSAGGSVSVEIWGLSSGSWADQSLTVTAYDWLLASGQTIASGTPVTLGYHNQSNRLIVTGATCTSS